jgi:N,N'-diacetyllegionaminate synthase
MNKVRIGNKLIGDGESCFIIAEAGVNHNGDIKLAIKLIDEAKSAGADAVKFQTFKSKGVTTAATGITEYQRKNMGRNGSQLRMLQDLELDYSAFSKLKEHCEEKGIIFLSTPHSFDAIDFLDPLVPAHKMGSGDLTNIPAIAKVAEKGKPILLSTGMATVDEIEEAIAAIRARGNDQIILLQCVTNYPSSLGDQNLKTIQVMRNEFNVLTGFSDHTIGTTAALVAVTLGACVVEKHFTLSRKLPGPDHKASMEPNELEGLIQLIREVELSLGDGEKKPTKDEEEIAAVARKSLVASIDIPEGTTISRDMIDIKRPQTGLRPGRLDDIIGKKAKKDIKQDNVLTEDMIDWTG